MAEIEWTKPVYIMGCDLIAYTDAKPFAQSAAKAKIDRWQATAVPRGAKHLGWADAGDGGYLLLDGPPDCAAEALRRFWTSNENEDRLKFRYCLNHGMVTKQTGQTGPLFSGDGMNEAARLLNGMDKDRLGQIVCSGAYRRILEREVEPGRYEFTRVPDIEGKRDERFEAWNFRMPGGPGVPIATIDFERFDDIELWLMTQSRDVIVAFAARAALRVAPSWARAMDHSATRDVAAQLSTGFCATLLAWFAGKWPNQARRVAKHADVAARAARVSLASLASRASIASSAAAEAHADPAAYTASRADRASLAAAQAAADAA
ncbi:MAG: hypothetical protein AAGF90_14430, partial [Pseudomonadota bacterium]